MKESKEWAEFVNGLLQLWLLTSINNEFIRAFWLMFIQNMHGITGKTEIRRQHSSVSNKNSTMYCTVDCTLYNTNTHPRTCIKDFAPFVAIKRNRCVDNDRIVNAYTQQYGPGKRLLQNWNGFNGLHSYKICNYVQSFTHSYSLSCNTICQPFPHVVGVIYELFAERTRKLFKIYSPKMQTIIACHAF